MVRSITLTAVLMVMALLLTPATSICQAEELVFAANADTFTLNGEVTWLDNRILVYGPGQERQPSAGFIQFPTPDVNVANVQSATLRIWLEPGLNLGQNPDANVTATILADSEDGWLEENLVEGGWAIGGGGTPFTPATGSESTTIWVADSELLEGQYFDWDVTAAVTGPHGAGNGFVGFELVGDQYEQNFYNPFGEELERDPIRFTDRTPANDSSTAGFGEAPQLVIVVSDSVPGDLNGDGTVDADDINYLFANPMDLNDDGSANQGDVEYFVEQTLGRLMGDTDLNAAVDEADLAWVADGWKLPGSYTWGTGDFTGDSAINEADLAYLADNWKQPAPSAAAVPEPTSILVLVAGAGLLGRCGARSRRS